MARRKPDKAGEEDKPVTGEFSAKMLEVYTGMLHSLTDRSAALGKTGPGWLSRSETLDVGLSRDDRRILLGLPELDDPLRERLEIAEGGDQGIPVMVEELASIFLALSQGLSKAEGPEAEEMIQVAIKLTSSLNDRLSRRPPPAGRRKGAAKKAKTSKGRGTIYQLKVTLKDVRPPIWRRVLVPDISLTRLHEILQVVMGWENYHLYDFEVRGDLYTDPRGKDDLDMEDASQVKLSQIASKEKAKFRYIYDFGDNWQHEVLVEKLLPSEAGKTYPVCVTGKRACPPEDVGGPWGYMEFAEAIQDPEHEQHEELLEWRGEFDPEAFDLDAVNQELRRLR